MEGLEQTSLIKHPWCILMSCMLGVGYRKHGLASTVNFLSLQFKAIVFICTCPYIYVHCVMYVCVSVSMSLCLCVCGPVSVCAPGHILTVRWGDHSFIIKSYHMIYAVDVHVYARVCALWMFHRLLQIWCHEFAVYLPCMESWPYRPGFELLQDCRMVESKCWSRPAMPSWWILSHVMWHVAHVALATRPSLQILRSGALKLFF